MSCHFFLNLNISDVLYTFILGKTSSFKNLRLNCFDFRICPEIPIKVTNMGYKHLSIDDFERKRIKGKKKVNALLDGFLILKYLLTQYLKKLFSH